MSDYYSVLKELAEKNINERIPCSSLHEIQKFYSVILNHKYSEIRIFCKDLGWLNNQYLIDLLSGFLYTPWNDVKILLKEDCDLAWLEQFAGNENLQIKIAKGSYSKPEAKEFAVIDDRCFRFEAPDFGIINFNHRDDSKPLIDHFNDAFKLGIVKELKKVENNNV